MALVALKRLRWGEGTLEPGEPVPEGEAGRDYGTMLRIGEIAEHADGAATAATVAQRDEAIARAEKAEAALAGGAAPPDETTDEVDVPDGVVPGETPGWPLGVFVVPLTDEQRAELAEAGISGTLTHEDLIGLLTPAGDPPDAAADPPDEASDDDALPDGVIASGGGWFLLPDGRKAHGRKALDAMLARDA